MLEQQGRRWAIVLAGGAGTRLSELTRGDDGRSVPKQFCSLRGGPSLLADALARAASLVGRERVVAVVAPEHRRYWQRELASLAPGNTIVQPANRGTAPGVLLPLCAILERDPEAIVALLPADHHVERERVLRRSLQRAFRSTEIDERERVMLLGITPEHAETQYGWIVPAADASAARAAGPFPSASRPVLAFVEKPDPERAAELRARGGLWNSFLVVGRGAAFLSLYARSRPELVPAFAAAFATAALERAERLECLYAHLSPSDFCRDLLEAAPDVLRVAVVPPCGWTDLGSPERVAECLARCTYSRGAASLDQTGGAYSHGAARLDQGLQSFARGGGTGS